MSVKKKIVLGVGVVIVAFFALVVVAAAMIPPGKQSIDFTLSNLRITQSGEPANVLGNTTTYMYDVDFVNSGPIKYTVKPTDFKMITNTNTVYVGFPYPIGGQALSFVDLEQGQHAKGQVGFTFAKGEHPKEIDYVDGAIKIQKQYEYLVSPITDSQRGGFDSPIAKTYDHSSVVVNGYLANVLIAKSTTQEYTGATIFNHLDDNQAMLFVFNQTQQHPFWTMKMSIPVDIIWLNHNGQVLHLEQNLQPCNEVSKCSSYDANSPSQYVLVTNGGFSQRHNVAVGSLITGSQIGL